MFLQHTYVRIDVKSKTYANAYLKRVKCSTILYQKCKCDSPIESCQKRKCDITSKRDSPDGGVGAAAEPPEGRGRRGRRRAEAPDCHAVSSSKTWGRRRAGGRRGVRVLGHVCQWGQQVGARAVRVRARAMGARARAGSRWGRPPRPAAPLMGWGGETGARQRAEAIDRRPRHLALSLPTPGSNCHFQVLSARGARNSARQFPALPVRVFVFQLAVSTSCVAVFSRHFRSHYYYIWSGAPLDRKFVRRVWMNFLFIADLCQCYILYLISNVKFTFEMSREVSIVFISKRHIEFWS